MKTLDKTFYIDHEQLEDVLISHLYAVGALNDDEEVTMVDFGLPINEDGQVEIELTIAKPVARATQLTLVL